MSPRANKWYLLLVIWAVHGCASLPADDAVPARMQVDSDLILAELALADGRAEDAVDLMLDAALLSDVPFYAERASQLAEEFRLTESGLAAVARWRDVAPDDDGPDWFSGVFNFRSGRYDQAIASFGDLLAKLSSESIGAGLALVTQALAEEANTGASTYVMAAVAEEYPDRLESHYGLARLAFRSGDFELALEHAKSATELQPDWLDAQMLYARTLLVAGQTEDSLELGRRLADQNRSVEVRLQYAELLLSAGRGADARVILNELLEDNPGLAEATRALAFQALAEDRLDDAERYFEELRGSEAYRNETFYYLGRIAESNGDALAATRSYSRVTQGTHAVEAQLRTARIMFDQTGDPEIALEHLEQFGNESPSFATDMLVARGQILMQIDRPDDAMQLIDGALEESPSDATLQNAHVAFFIDLSQQASSDSGPEEAQRWLNQGLDRYPDDPSLRYSQALLLEDQGRMRKAASVLEDLVEDYPDNPAMLNALGYLLTDQFDRHDEAEDYIRRALAMDPDNAAIIDSMGWVLFKLGDYEAALSYLERAARLVTDPEMIAHLVDTHWMLGNRELAMQLLEKHLAEFPESRHLIEVNERLNR